MPVISAIHRSALCTNHHERLQCVANCERFANFPSISSSTVYCLQVVEHVTLCDAKAAIQSIRFLLIVCNVGWEESMGGECCDQSEQYGSSCIDCKEQIQVRARYRYDRSRRHCYCIVCIGLAKLASEQLAN
jgi:hypothetical protein